MLGFWLFDEAKMEQHNTSNASNYNLKPFYGKINYLILTVKEEVMI